MVKNTSLKKRYLAANIEFIKTVSDHNFTGYYDETLLKIVKKHNLTISEYQGCSKTVTS